MSGRSNIEGKAFRVRVMDVKKLMATVVGLPPPVPPP